MENPMKYLYAAAAITVLTTLALAATTAHAQTYTTQRLGNTDFTTGPNGSYTTQHIGNTDFTNGPNGFSATTQHIGPNSFTTVNPGYQPLPPLIGQPYR
jgi:hypothetical protein